MKTIADLPEGAIFWRGPTAYTKRTKRLTVEDFPPDKRLFLEVFIEFALEPGQPLETLGKCPHCGKTPFMNVERNGKALHVCEDTQVEAVPLDL